MCETVLMTATKNSNRCIDLIIKAALKTGLFDENHRCYYAAIEKKGTKICVTMVFGVKCRKGCNESIVAYWNILRKNKIPSIKILCV